VRGELFDAIQREILDAGLLNRFDEPATNIGLPDRWANHGASSHRWTQSMTTRSKRTLSSVLHGLLYTSGFMMIVCAVPVGAAIALQSHYKFHVEARDAGIQGVVLTVATAVVGGVLLLLGTLVTRIRRRG